MSDFDFQPRPQSCRFRQEYRDPIAEFGHGVARAAVGAFLGCLLALLAWEKIAEARLKVMANQFDREMQKAIKRWQD